MNNLIDILQHTSILQHYNSSIKTIIGETHTSIHFIDNCIESQYVPSYEDFFLYEENRITQLLNIESFSIINDQLLKNKIYHYFSLSESEDKFLAILDINEFIIEKYSI